MASVSLRFCCTLIMFSVLITLSSKVNGSAIPMWEFLSRSEKMSHLYSTFAKQVSAYCKSSGDTQPAQCKRELLVYGLGKLHEMSETHLDGMDPYQRGANDIIWDSMMTGHPSHPKKETTTLSSILLPTGQYKRNPLFDEQKTNKKSISNSYAADMELSNYGSLNYPTGMDAVYSEPQNYLPQESPTNLNVQFAYPISGAGGLYGQSNFLSGPMVIRVRPDGTPVEEDKLKPLPFDDDRDEMVIGKDKLPTMEQIAEIFREVTTKNSNKYSTYQPIGYKNYRISDRTYVRH